MKNQWIAAYLNCSNLLVRQRIRKVLRVRYGILIVQERKDPSWLSAHSM